MKNKPYIRLTIFFLAIMLTLCACAPVGGSSENPFTTSGSTNAPSSAGTSTGQGSSQPTRTDCSHADEDNDGLCDLCNYDVTVLLDFYAFNDLHGVFHDTQSNPGVDELTAYLKNAYADDSAYEIVLSSGDMWQGSVESSSNKGALMTEWMNELGFVSMTLGNHEFDWGGEQIAENAQIAEFPFLGINVIDSGTGTSYCKASTVVEQGGVKIGIIGAIGDCLSSISGEFTADLTFLTGDALTELVKAEATRLRQEGCDFVVYSLHAGTASSYSGIQDVDMLDYYDTELSNGYIDLVFEAHTHKNYVLRDNYGVYHIQAGGYNSALSYVSVRFNTVNDTYEIRTAETQGNAVYANEKITADPLVEELFREYFPTEDPYTDVIGTNGKKRNSNELADLVARLYLEKGRELWEESYGPVVLGGGFLKTRTPYDLQAGDVTYSQLFSLMPFDNDLVLCQVTGRQLKQVFINGSRNYHCAYDEDLVIDDNELYYVVTDTYTSFYKYNMFREVARLEDFYARDLLREYIADGNWSGK